MKSASDGFCEGGSLRTPGEGEAEAPSVQARLRRRREGCLLAMRTVGRVSDAAI